LVVGATSRRSTSSLEGNFAVAILLYETDDDDFVDRALHELTTAGIRCHRWGPATVGDGSFRGRIGGTASIYIEEETDYRAANQILVRLGAAQDKPIGLPSSWKTRVILLIAAIAFVGAMAFLFRSA
jgi:hypothetical protein